MGDHVVGGKRGANAGQVEVAQGTQRLRPWGSPRLDKSNRRQQEGMSLSVNSAATRNLPGIVDGSSYIKYPSRSIGSQQGIKVGHHSLAVEESMSCVITSETGRPDDLPSSVEANGIAIVSAQSAEVAHDTAAE